MPTRVLITVDTELTWRHHRHGGWEENFRRSYQAAGVGIPYQLEVLAEHGLRACFFVDPMPALLFGPEPVERMIAPIVAAGQEVQLHLHPFWARLAEGKEDRRELAEYGADEQNALVATARRLLIEAGAEPAVAFRAGSYAANADTLRALAANGLRYDSSHNGCHHPRPSALPLPAAQLAPIEVEGVVEVPVTVIADRPGRLRHLQICAVSLAELQAALDHAAANRHPLVTIVSHSFELATRDGRSVNRLARDRFAGLCRHLAARRDALPTATFADLDDLPLGQPATPLDSAFLRTARRMVGQAWGNAIYERRLVG
jgi:peptidoglycan/xylan/chitin deacetylase (PgdA/CDA1 family)